MLIYFLKILATGIVGANLDKLYLGYRSYRRFRELNKKKKSEKKLRIKTNIKPIKTVYIRPKSI